MVQLAEKGLTIAIAVFTASAILSQYIPFIELARDFHQMAMLRTTTHEIARTLTESYQASQPRQYLVKGPHFLELRVAEGRLVVSDGRLRYEYRLPIPIEEALLQLQPPACIESLPMGRRIQLRVCGDGN